MSRPQEPIRFTRGQHSYLIALDHTGGPGYLGFRDGRVVARAIERAVVAHELIKAQQRGA
jgi:hypothetical protein